MCAEATGCGCGRAPIVLDRKSRPSIQAALVRGCPIDLWMDVRAFPEGCVARCSSGHIEIVDTGRSADTAENRLCQQWTERFEVVVTVPATPTGNGTCETIQDCARRYIHMCIDRRCAAVF